MAKNNEKSQIDKKRITRADERCADLRAVDVPEGPTLAVVVAQFGARPPFHLRRESMYGRKKMAPRQKGDVHHGS
jgi:hypothetical protein